MKTIFSRRTIASLLAAIPIAVLPSVALADDTASPTDSHWVASAAEGGSEGLGDAAASPLNDSHW